MDRLPFGLAPEACDDEAGAAKPRLHVLGPARFARSGDMVAGAEAVFAGLGLGRQLLSNSAPQQNVAQ